MTEPENAVVPADPPAGLADQINAAHARAEEALRAGLTHAREVGALLLHAKG